MTSSLNQAASRLKLRFKKELFITAVVLAGAASLGAIIAGAVLVNVWLISFGVAGVISVILATATAASGVPDIKPSLKKPHESKFGGKFYIMQDWVLVVMILLFVAAAVVSTIVQLRA